MVDGASFRVPVARDARGRLVTPEEASRSGRYACPSCGETVDLHAGEKKRRHFHHRTAACSAETVLHLSAKELVVAAVESWRAGAAPAPAFERRCASEGCARTTRQALPKKVLRAVAELRTPSGHVVDVGLLGPADLPIAAIEILVSHEVDDAKAFELGLPWIEVDAAQVCETGGRVLAPVRDRFLPWLCDEHATERGVAAREERDDRKLRSSLARALPYRLDEFPGYAIAGVTTCPNGHATLAFAWEGDEPPWPRPPHVVACEAGDDWLYDAHAKRARRVLPFRRAWASACTSCGARLPRPR